MFLLGEKWKNMAQWLQQNGQRARTMGKVPKGLEVMLELGVWETSKQYYSFLCAVFSLFHLTFSHFQC